jgi:calcium-dependent protein kinase
MATNRKLGIVCAVKQITKKLVEENGASSLFEEVNILIDLDHPNIVKLYDLYEDDLNYMMVTEYCSGGELFERIKDNSSFSENIAAGYMKQLLSAIVYLHSQGIVHRDLKPENLLFENETDEANLKLIDFGVSTKFEGGQKMKETIGTVFSIFDWFFF